MNLVDIAIVLVVAFGLFLGWSRGLIGPLLAEGTFLLGYWLTSTHPNLVGPLLPQGALRPLATLSLLVVISFAVGFAGRILLGAAFRLPLARQADKLLGAALNGVLAIVIVYVVLIGLAGADKVLSPINGAVSIGPEQIAAMRTLLAQYPLAGGVVGTSELGQLEAAASTHPIPLGQLGQYASIISWYERDLRPQLARSRLAPLVLNVGEHIPVIGRQVTLPAS